MVWRFEHQCTDPPNHIKKAGIDLDLNKSNNISGELGFGTEASCGTQFASVKGNILL